ncbi:hypothetical protein V499_00989 [Pseudogymnoascus sp. VKM F-103]|uniref:Uncharacterized protein n=1 Tax=Pseudogymnoascus verrucosus TaxID=342668 RepID=A0A1B8GL54_9PEZI|nr:uncharacterized protein VE01_05327 [Pseudogymnoascus verrucosus]KFY80100.1 hypothetical protein V499_00989 [Pseudogymnoascus sp. VKM F-103]OBT96571.2 hypothetical protein VE01_05327 [Pseudogymnoascus verrucosus]
MPLLATPLPSPERTTRADSLSKRTTMSTLTTTTSQTPMLPALPPRSSLRASRLFEFTDLTSLTALSPPPRPAPTTTQLSPASTPELSPSNPYETYLSSASSEEDEDESDGSTSDSDAESEPAFIAEAVARAPIKTAHPEPSSEGPQTHSRHSSQPDVARAIELVAVGPATLILIPQPRPLSAPRRASTTSALTSRSSFLPPISTTSPPSARRPTPLRLSTAPAPRFPSLFPSVSSPSLPFLETDPFSASSPGMTASPAPLSPALSTTSTSRDGLKQRLGDVRRGLVKGAEAAAAAAAKGRRRPSMGRLGFSGWKADEERERERERGGSVTPVSALQQEEMAASIRGRRGSDTASIRSTRSVRRADTPPQLTPLSQRASTLPQPQAYTRPISQRPPSQLGASHRSSSQLSLRPASQLGLGLQQQAGVRYEDIMRAAKEKARTTAPDYAPPPPPPPQEEEKQVPKLGRRKSGVFGAMGMGIGGRRKSIRL